MKVKVLIFLFYVGVIAIHGQELSFGKITITPYISPKVELDANAKSLLYDKLCQIVTRNDATGGFDNRFLITPSINVLSESETATIPQKSALKVSVTFYLGDGVAGTLYNSYNMETTGVGSTHDVALYSAIKKIKVKDAGLQSLIKEGKERIISYYNSNGSSLIKKAEGFISAQKYENALACLSVIPSFCNDYQKAQSLISKCGSRIIERDNNAYLTKAKSVWSANPNKDGAKEASIYLSHVVITSPYYKNEVEKMSKMMRHRLSQLEDKQIELEKVKILSEEHIETERINASSRVMSSFVSTLPSIVYNIIRWF